MKTLINIFILSFAMFLIGCGDKNIKNKNMNISDLPFKPSTSINQTLLTDQQIKNTAAWQVAFKFLKENDLVNLPIGRYDLSNGVFATVADYQTKEPETVKYEAHRKYIDIQYVAKGCECIELMSLKDIKEPANYKEESDIVFFKGKKGTRLYADKKQFFVFFPEDVHKPCLKVDTSREVRKIVVKIPWVP